MRLFLKLVFVSFLVFSASGCVAVLLGAGVLGGVAISDDTVQSYVDRDFSSLWRLALGVAEKMGSVTEKDKDKGLIKAVIEKSNVVIKLEVVTEKTTRVEISARKVRKLLPNIDMATRINNRIVAEAGKSWF